MVKQVESIPNCKLLSGGYNEIDLESIPNSMVYIFCSDLGGGILMNNSGVFQAKVAMRNPEGATARRVD
jgi:hypothetical protein